MNTVNEIRKVFDRCDLMLAGDVISKEPLMQAQWNYLCDLADNEGAFGAVLHTGASAYNAIILFFCALLTIANRNTDNKNLVLSLQKGDWVIYTDKAGKSERFIFDGTEKEYNPVLKQSVRYALIVQEGSSKGARHKIPENRWNAIKPYYGESTSLDGKGLRKESKLKSEFYHSVMGMETPNLVDASAVIVCSRQYYEYLFDMCSIKFNNNEISLSDIASAAFYTDSTEVRHGGDVSKAEPMLKFTSSAEYARKASRQKTGNTICGVFVLGEDILSKNLSQFPQIAGYKRLPIFAASVRIDSPTAEELETLSEKSISYFACTQSFLQGYEKTPIVQNEQTAELQKQIDLSVNRKLKTVILKDIYRSLEYSALLDTIRLIKNDNYQSSEKELFIINSFSLAKLLNTAVFPIAKLNSLIEENKVDAVSFSERIRMLEKAKAEFPVYLQKTADKVIQSLTEACQNIENENGKEQQLRSILSSYHTKRVAVLVNKSYFETVLSEMNLRRMINNLGEMTITTPNRLDLGRTYDAIISTCGYNGKKFNPVECISAHDIYTLLYKCELPFHTALKQKYERKQAVYRGKEYDGASRVLGYRYESEWLDEYREAEAEYENVRSAETEIESFVDEINKRADIRQYMRAGGISSVKANTIVTATFENDAKAFFTKMYRAYVFDEANSKVKETPAEELQEGDQVLFFRSSGHARDLVTDILEHLINSNKLSNAVTGSYEKSKRWKNDLKQYQTEHGLSDSQLAAGLKQHVSVQEITIRQWLDEDSHTVGPHDAENLKGVGAFTHDEDLENNFMDYFNACREIRRVRGDILNYIGRAIVMHLTGEQPDSDEIYSMIYNDIDNMGDLLEVKHIVKADNIVPINMINRPLTIRE